MNQIGNNIKELRKNKGITQEQLAERLNVTHQAVSNWETGKTQPDIQMLETLAEVFEVSLEEIIYGEEKKKLPITVESGSKAGIGFGAVLAMIISYTQWHSIGWAILHGILGWVYVIYYIIKY